MTSIFLTFKAYSVSYHTVYHWECSMCIWEECIFCFLEMKCSVYILKLLDIVSFNAGIFLLIFRLDDLFIVDSGVLKSAIMTVLLSISFSKYSKIFFMYLGAPILGVDMCIRVISSCWIDLSVLWSDVCLFLCPLFEVYFVRCKYSYLSFFSISIYMEYFFPFLHFHPV